MKRNFTYLLLSLIAISAYGQKTSLNKMTFECKYIQLPSKPLPSDTRDYYIDSTVDPYFEDIAETVISRIKIEGVMRGEKSGAKIIFNLSPITISEKEIIKEKHESKDKDGKVTTSYTFYYKVNYKDNITYQIKDSKDKQLWWKSSSSFSIKHKSKDFSSHKLAQSHLNNNLNNLIDKFNKETVDASIKDLNKQANFYWGYQQKISNNKFMFLSSKKNSDFDAHKEIAKTIEENINRISFTQIPDEAKQSLIEASKKLDAIALNYPEDKRKHAKMRYTTYYNNATIFFLLEDYVNAKKYANLLIENNHNKSNGHKILEEIEELKTIFKANNTITRHFNLVNYLDKATASQTNLNNNLLEHIVNMWLNEKNENIAGIIFNHISFKNDMTNKKHTINFNDGTIEIVDYKNNSENILEGIHFELREGLGGDFQANIELIYDQLGNITSINVNNKETFSIRFDDYGRTSSITKYHNNKIAFELGANYRNFPEIELRPTLYKDGVGVKAKRQLKFILDEAKNIQAYDANFYSAKDITYNDNGLINRLNIYNPNADKWVSMQITYSPENSREWTEMNLIDFAKIVQEIKP